MNASAIFAFFRPSRTDFALLNAFSNAGGGYDGDGFDLDCSTTAASCSSTIRIIIGALAT